MPETQIVIGKDTRDPQVLLTTVRDDRTRVADSPERHTSWDLTEDGRLTHKNPTYYICKAYALLWRLALFAIGIYMIVVGGVFFHSCPLADAKIPVYMIVGGVFLMPLVLFALYMRNNRPDKALEGLWKILGFLICLPIALFLFAWSIAGLVWVYGSIPYVDLVRPESAEFCHPVLFVSSAVCIFLTFLILTAVMYISVVYFRRGVRRGVRRN
ncbi:uncharacterized protein LOC129591272 [Paramacrobiotus metropolitanus]|uniref:uncharacterized protein LOC129591272 n=1 Tax=Paramacrobiotus metropolitanus TaxID=2943436 RepID=UPI002445E5FF|nr:uncharacterized protein LOC129591272 [Paramacrobiotus metropolitanus]XP_055342842.1 uncharacterized protein LOC129591272 [Paramacrobiotus metropolitanus]XP_055342845.1 uncharacterized protein LOC129591272 [Paramacrobiotus metropolitanus]